MCAEKSKGGIKTMATAKKATNKPAAKQTGSASSKASKSARACSKKNGTTK